MAWKGTWAIGDKEWWSVGKSMTGNIYLPEFHKDLFLGPLLFLIYANYIIIGIDCEILLFANDTCLL